MAKSGQSPTGKSRVSNIKQIHQSFVNKLMDPGLKNIYPPKNIPIEVWNLN